MLQLGNLLIIYGEARRCSANIARLIYANRFPYKSLPNCATFLAVFQRLLYTAPQIENQEPQLHVTMLQVKPKNIF